MAQSAALRNCPIEYDTCIGCRFNFKDTECVRNGVKFGVPLREILTSHEYIEYLDALRPTVDPDSLNTIDWLKVTGYKKEVAQIRAKLMLLEFRLNEHLSKAMKPSDL